MDRQEAINNVRSFIGQLTPECQESIRALVPELKESEDERIRRWLSDILDESNWGKDWPYTKQQVIAYLEKQKEQKPAEWSEVDKQTLDSIISIVEDWESKQSEEEKEYYGATQKSDWLKGRFKSLRPQPHWKPSEEEMEELDNARHNLIASCEVLTSLYEQLKKL